MYTCLSSTKNLLFQHLHHSSLERKVINKSINFFDSIKFSNKTGNDFSSFITRRKASLSFSTIIISSISPSQEKNNDITETKATILGKKSKMNFKTVDSHLHVWATLEESNKFPYFPGQEPSIPGNVDFLIKCMDDAGIDHALIVQPINHKFDHSYMKYAINKYPSKFAGCCLANPSDDGIGISQLESNVSEDGFLAVRFNPYLWPNGQKMTNSIGKLLFKKAGELNVPVGFMCFKGFDLHVDEIEELCKFCPETKVIMDHFGFCKPPTNDEEKVLFEKLLNLSRFPQVYIKVSAFFRVSRQPYPYEDTWQLMHAIIDRFGANRVMWGSDFPFILEECGYSQASTIPSLSGSLSDEQIVQVMGKTAIDLFPQAWN